MRGVPGQRGSCSDPSQRPRRRVWWRFDRGYRCDRRSRRRPAGGSGPTSHCPWCVPRPSSLSAVPTLVEAARELMESGTLRRIHRPDVELTLEYLTAVAHEAARTRTRHLILLSGLPGTGKTLVGLQLAHARFLDDLAVARSGGKPTAPAVYLSGNGPLVEVLQYELRSAGGGGRAFVRAVKAYVDTYSRRPGAIPPEHVLIFDEAQRAFDAEQVRATHKDGPIDNRSEPDHFIDFAERSRAVRRRRPHWVWPGDPRRRRGWNWPVEICR